MAIRPPRVAQQRRIISEPTNDQIYDTLDKPVYERDSWLHSVDDLLKRSVHYHVKVRGGGGGVLHYHFKMREMGPTLLCQGEGDGSYTIMSR